MCNCTLVWVSILPKPPCPVHNKPPEFGYWVYVCPRCGYYRDTPNHELGCFDVHR